MMKRDYTAKFSAQRSSGKQVVGELCCRDIEDRDADGIVIWALTDAMLTTEPLLPMVIMDLAAQWIDAKVPTGLMLMAPPAAS
jgi:hypothetical protein